MGQSAATRTADKMKHVRFTFRQDQEIDEVVEYLGTTRQNLIQEATMKRVAEVRAEIRADEDYRKHRKQENGRKREIRGFGLKFPERAESFAVEEQPQPPPQVVVNVPAASSSVSGELAMLADFVVKGSSITRSTRYEQAKSIISTSLNGSTKDAALASLDAAIKAREPQRTGVLDWLKRAT